MRDRIRGHLQRQRNRERGQAVGDEGLSQSYRTISQRPSMLELKKNMVADGN